MSETTTAAAPAGNGDAGTKAPTTLFSDGGAAGKPGAADGGAAKAADGGGDNGAGKPAAGEAPWKQSIAKWSPERRGLFENAGWLKDGDLNVDELARGYEELVKFRGAPAGEVYRLSKNPTPEELARVHEKIGVPKDVTGYGLKAAEGQDPKTLERIANVALGAKATPDQVKAFLTLNAEMHQEQVAAEAAAEAEVFDRDGKELARDWGGALKQNQAIARRAAELKAFTEHGLDEGFWAAAAKLPGPDGKPVGPGKIARALHALGLGLGEDTFVTGEEKGGGLRTPDGAQARVEEIRKTPELRKKYLAKDPALVREMEALQKAISAGRTPEY